MRSVQIQNEEFRFLSTWEEVTPDLLPLLLPHIYNSDRTRAGTDLVPLLCDIPPLVLAQLRPWQYAELAQLCSWIWELPLTLPIIPRFEHQGKIYLLPQAMMVDSPFIEYDHLDNFLAAADDDTLPNVVATLCRPPGPDGHRTRFDGLQLPALRAQLADLPQWLQAYIFLFATGCARQLREDYAEVWEADPDAPTPDARYDLSRPEDNVDFSWTGAAFSIAEEGAFGTYHQVIYTDCHTILYYLAWKKQQARLLKKQLKTG